MYRFPGSASAGKAPAYASGGYYLKDKTPNMLADEMLGYVKAGYRADRMKVGGPDPQQEEERIHAVREAIGPDIPLMLDANNAWCE